MSFKFTVTNFSSVPNARYWGALFVVDGQSYSLNQVESAGNFLELPVAGHIDHAVIGLYDISKVYLGGMYTKDIYYGVTAVDGQRYTFNWETNQFSSLAEPVFSNIAVRISNQAPSFNEPLDVWVDFDYSGGDMIGNTAIKLAIGHDGISGFDEVQPMVWVKLINVYEANSNHQSMFTISIPSSVSPGVYDLRVELGTYPWSNEVYAKKTFKKFLTIPTAHPPTPPPTPPDEDKKVNWTPYAIIGGVGLIVVFLLMRK